MKNFAIALKWFTIMQQFYQNEIVNDIWKKLNYYNIL